MSVGKLGLQHRGGYRADLAGREGLAVSGLDSVDDALGTAIVGERKRDGRVLDGIRCVGDAHTLIRSEIEELVFLDGAAQSGSELVAVQERHLGGDIR